MHCMTAVSLEMSDEPQNIQDSSFLKAPNVGAFCIIVCFHFTICQIFSAVVILIHGLLASKICLIAFQKMPF